MPKDRNEITPNGDKHFFKVYAIKTDLGIEYAIRFRYYVFCNPTLNPELIPGYSDYENEDYKNVVAVHNIIEFKEWDHSLFWKAFQNYNETKEKEKNK